MKHTQTMKHTLTLLIVLLVSLVCGPVAAQAESDAGGPLIPSIAGEWWRAAYSPELPELDSKRGEIVDHTFFRDADGTWQLWTQIRGTRHDRVFFRWTGSTDFENDKQAWKPHRVCWVGDPHAGEMPRTIQAPHCYSEDGRWHMFYGGGGSISRADSDDGHVFIRARNSDGFSRLFADLSNRTPSGMRDPYLFKADDGRYHLYYTWKDHVMARTADRPDAAEWSEGVIVSTTPNASQCPTVVRIGNWYYLFKMGGSGEYRTAVYASRDPLDFGGVEAKSIATLPASAAEVLQIGNRWYISSLIPHRNGEGKVIGHAGVRLAPIEWKPASND
ncbi:MAG TPA: hypothetical protein QF564_27075 [Pirellulaceae bacterium]|jgi:hypothetical protein|nr:hypothetical protein [Pirellulaceae bacterium]